MGQGDKYEDNCLDVFQYFNSSCYKGFGDDKEVRKVSLNTNTLTIVSYFSQSKKGTCISVHLSTKYLGHRPMHI